MADIAIIGSGIMGACLALECADRGLDVLLLEADSHAPSLNAPSFGDTRLFRMAYFEAPDYVPLLRASRDGWLDYERRFGERFFETNGVLFVGSSESQLIQGAAAASEEFSIPIRRFAPEFLLIQYPWFRFHPGDIAMLDELGGWLRAGAALQAVLLGGLAAGVKLMPGCPVTVLKETDAGVAISTAGTTFEAKRAVVCAGLGLGEIEINGRKLQPTLTRQVLTYWNLPGNPLSEKNNGPAFAFEEPDGSFFYGVPRNPDQPGVKIALHNLGSVVEGPLDYSTRLEDAEEIQPFLNRRIATESAEFVSAKVCHYESVNGTDFSLGLFPGSNRIGVVAGTSGHGFKFGPGIAKAMVDLVVEGDKSGIPDLLSLDT